MRRVLLVSILVVAPAGSAAAQFELTVPRIMRGPETVGREPVRIGWSPDAQWIYFSWLPPGTEWKETLKPYKVRAQAGATPVRMSPAEADSVAPLMAAGSYSADRKRRVVSVRGDLYIVELPGGAVRRLTATSGVNEVNPRFDQQGRRVIFQRENNIFALDIVQGGVQQLTDLRPGPAPEDSSLTQGQRGFLEREQRALLGAIADRRWRDSVDKSERAQRNASAPKPVYLARGEQLATLDPSPTGTAVLLIAETPATDRRIAVVPSYVTITGYTEDIPARSKVGDAPTRQRVGMLTVATGAVTWISKLPGDSGGVFGGVGSMGWNDAGTSVLVRAVTRDYNVDRLLRIDADSARTRELYALRDSAWVGGACQQCGGWLAGSQGIWFVSEEDGYAQLYTMDADGGSKRQRTRGKWEVQGAELTSDRTQWLLHTSEVSPFERHAYLLPVAESVGGSGAVSSRLTSDVGGHTVVLAPDGKLLADVFSTANRPPELFLQVIKGGARGQLTTSPTAEWLSHKWIKPEIISIPASDGVQVPARIYRPADVGAEANGAAVIFVHGAGYLHNVHNFWSSYFREYQFHHLLASKGFVVLDVDYRGSAGYGRDWRTAIYRWMGGRDLQDQVDAVRYLQQNFAINPERVGIYGGSYGGFITLMALFTEPKWFGAGAALRPVTDWAYYNHGYTADILNEPQDDSTAYRKSSPIYFAEGLEDPLLILHGMVDVNVHYQDVVRLSQRLIELGKTDWWVASYPVEDHGFVRPDSWTDEYRRILELFLTRLKPK